MDQYRQGESYIKEIKATAPTTRTDGSDLEAGLITGYLFDMAYEGGLSVDGMLVQLVDGKFTEKISVDDQAPGVYTLTYKTQTARFPSGGPVSEPYMMEILAPLAPPSPPKIG